MKRSQFDEAVQAFCEFEKKHSKKKYLDYLEQATSESQMQLFFESNPIVLPGLFDRHNGPYEDIVISKLRLADEYVTDFAFISVDSGNAQITLIEIESPNIKIFRNSDGQFSAPLNKAIQQMRDWTSWLSTNETFTKDLLRKIYHRSVFRYQHVISKVILVAGRREQVTQNVQREKRRKNGTAGCPIYFSCPQLGFTARQS
ncbi:MAG: DUF4263 domain-containing protein [Nitrospirae bacterium]|nr:DUF4263 domain-containing protein [Nitrospirota bacterium]MCL5978307.1 DUF4263 domain-containing protein [Nitrospirota bacterium]